MKVSLKFEIPDDRVEALFAAIERVMDTINAMPDVSVVDVAIDDDLPPIPE